MTVTDKINHVSLVLDRSTSMSSHQRNLIRVADGLIKHLADQSVAMDQETRVTVYTFGNDVECVIFDKDVLRLPSISGLYRIRGMTALVDATYTSIADLQKTATMYGDHAFLTYVLTDGMENASRRSAATLRGLLGDLDDSWTVAALVPNKKGADYARQVGFPQFNIAEWDAANTVNGIDDAVARITTATDNYMTSRAAGVRSTKNLFAVDASVVNRTNLRQTNLVPVDVNDVKVFEVNAVWHGQQIRDFVIDRVGEFKKGKNFYQLTKREKIQPGKEIAVVRRDNGKVFAGDTARHALGLPEGYVEVVPSAIPDFDVFIQSNSVNRKLVAGTKVLVF